MLRLQYELRSVGISIVSPLIVNIRDRIGIFEQHSPNSSTMVNNGAHHVDRVLFMGSVVIGNWECYSSCWHESLVLIILQLRSSLIGCWTTPTKLAT